MTDKIIIRIDVEPDEGVQIKGSFGYDTQEENDAAVKWVEDQLESGNMYAWCWVKVTARCGPFIGTDTLGGCSYLSLDDLKKHLRPDMEHEAMADLRRTMAEAIKTAREAERLLPLLTRKQIPVEYEEEN